MEGCVTVHQTYHKIDRINISFPQKIVFIHQWKTQVGKCGIFLHESQCFSRLNGQRQQRNPLLLFQNKLWNLWVFIKYLVCSKSITKFIPPVLLKKNFSEINDKFIKLEKLVYAFDGGTNAASGRALVTVVRGLLGVGVGCGSEEVPGGPLSKDWPARMNERLSHARTSSTYGGRTCVTSQSAASGLKRRIGFINNMFHTNYVGTIKVLRYIQGVQLKTGPIVQN